MASGMFRITCPACHAIEHVDLGTIVLRFRALGHLRRSVPDRDTVMALAPTASVRLCCQTCGARGVRIGGADDRVGESARSGAWPNEVLNCEACRAPLDPERLTVFPDARHCTRCQSLLDSQRIESPGDETMYCPRCGSALRTTLSTRGPTASYEQRCDGCGYRG